MARNLYILSGVLLLFAILSFVMSLTSAHAQPALPANGSLWRSSALFLTVAGLIMGLFAIMTALFEQIDRRTEDRRLRHRSGGMPPRTR